MVVLNGRIDDWAWGKIMKYLARDLGLALMALALIHACGGGGDDAPAGTALSLPTPAGMVLSDQWVVDCQRCGALDANTYAGTGAGVWFYRNTGSQSVELPIRISGLGGQNVLLIYTNEGAQAAPMPALKLKTASGGVAAGASPTGRAATDPAPETISQDNARLLNDLLEQRQSYLAAGSGRPRVAAGAAPALSEGATRTVVDPYRGETLTLTLRKRISTIDGAYKVNLWVDDREFGAGKMSEATLAQFAAYFASTVDRNIYSLASGLIGKPWGEHGYVNLIDASQDLNLVFYNSNSAGWAGYYAASDQVKKGWYSKSNEWLALYIASDRLYEGASTGSLRWAASTMAHELTHMIHFYQRAVVRGQAFDLWLNEMTAMGMEDIIDSRVFGEAYSTTEIMHYPNWLAGGNYNCPLTTWIGLGWSNGCNSYAVSGSFGAFLLRQYGLDYYRSLFSSTQTSSLAMLDEAIIGVGGSGYRDALRRWGASLAMFSLNVVPDGHGYPRRLQGGFDLMGFEGAFYRSLRRLPATVPDTLAPLAHFPLDRGRVNGVYAETLSVPPGTALTVTIQ